MSKDISFPYGYLFYKIIICLTGKQLSPNGCFSVFWKKRAPASGGGEGLFHKEPSAERTSSSAVFRFFAFIVSEHGRLQKKTSPRGAGGRNLF